MASAVQSPQPSQSSKQWWSKQTASKIPSASYRPSPASAPATPVMAIDEKGMRAMSKGSKKFNTLASVMGFKSKKSHPMINIPAGPVSPPLPFQSPPPPEARSPRSRTMTLTSPASYQEAMSSPVDPSIYTLPSSEEAYEAITPSDHLSRHRTSYQPSLFTFAEQQDHAMPGRLGDHLRYHYDARRISVMSDPSIIDPHMPKEQILHPSRASGSSYLQPDYKSVHGSILIGISHAETYDESEAYGESNSNADVDEARNSRESTESRKRDHRFSDSGIPFVPKVHSPAVPLTQGTALRKYPSVNTSVSSGMPLKTKARSDSLFSNLRSREDGSIRTQKSGRERMGSLQNNDSSRDGLAPLSFSKTLPTMSTRPKAASVSAGSSNMPSVRAREGARARPSVNTSFSRSGSIASGVSGSVRDSVHRQPSSSRLRNVPPSRTPPPRVDLPPTPNSQPPNSQPPNSQPPSPLTFSVNKNASASSLLKSAYSPTTDDPSILAFSPPSPSSSDSGSSISLCFARPGQTSFPNSPEDNIPPTHGRKFDHSFPAGNSLRSQKSPRGNVTLPRHDNKASMSSGHTLMNTFGIRDEAQAHRMRRSASQQSISTHMTSGRASQDSRLRVDSGASASSAALLSEEGSTSMFGSVGRLRKQRSMHNARGAFGSLALPPLPQQLRHANSFNTSSGEGPGNGQQAKGESGTQRRTPHSSTPASLANSVVHTPTTPQTHKKRLLFSSHGRERRDSNARSERDKLESQYAEPSEKKKGHAGLALFTGHFSPSGSSAQASASQTSLRDPTREAARMSFPILEDVPQPQSPTSTGNLLDQHILPPKELLSQMEALADIEEPSSPPQFALKDLGSEGEDEWSWDGTSISTTDKDGVRSRVSSLGATSVSFDWPEDTSVTSVSTRLFANATGSIHSRLQNERPSTASRLPTRNALSVAKNAATVNGRPSTADPTSSSHGAFEQAEIVPVALPPPPRRKGVVVSSTHNDSHGGYRPTPPLSPPPASHSTNSSQRTPRESGGGLGLQRLSSIETISAYNPNRGSIFRKPSFLDISDNFAEAAANDRASMASVPEDSFLILERGKDSLDMASLSEEYLDEH